MTQGIVSVRVNGIMRYKLVTGHDGMIAPRLAQKLRDLGRVPTAEEIWELALAEGFGCEECLVLLENVDLPRPKLHCDQDSRSDVEACDRYFDTFYVAQFNPRWKYGTADYVEVVDLPQS